MPRRAGNPLKKTNAWRIHARAQNKDRHSLDRIRDFASREPSDTPPDLNYFVFAHKGVTLSTTPYKYYQGIFMASLSVQPTPPREIFSHRSSNQRGSKILVMLSVFV